jgi:hypothetical protein
MMVLPLTRRAGVLDRCYQGGETTSTYKRAAARDDRASSTASVNDRDRNHH